MFGENWSVWFFLFYPSVSLFVGERDKPATNQLPEANSLSDGFVDRSTGSLTPLVPTTPNREEEVTDYKEEKLVEVESRPDLIVNDFQSCEGDNGSSEPSRTFPVELSEYVSCGEDAVKSDAGSPNVVSENVVRKPEQGMAPVTDGDKQKHAGETCQNSEKCNVHTLLNYAYNP